MSFPYDVPLKDLLTLFLFVDLIVMAAVGIIMYKTRHKKGKTEQLLEEIRDVLRQNPNGCAEKLAIKSNSELTKNAEKEMALERLQRRAPKEVVEIKEEAAEEKPSENKPEKEVSISPIDRERIYYEIEESTEARNDESTDLNLVKNALKDGPVIKPLLKMPKYIDDLVNRSRQNESPTEQTEVATSAESTLPPPPPPPTPTQTANTKNNERQKESE
jgi:hypothetical protein